MVFSRHSLSILYRRKTHTCRHGSSVAGSVRIAGVTYVRSGLPRVVSADLSDMQQALVETFCKSIGVEASLGTLYLVSSGGATLHVHRKYTWRANSVTDSAIVLSLGLFVYALQRKNKRLLTHDEHVRHLPLLHVGIIDVNSANMQCLHRTGRCWGVAPPVVCNGIVGCCCCFTDLAIVRPRFQPVVINVHLPEVACLYNCKSI